MKRISIKLISIVLTVLMLASIMAPISALEYFGNKISSVSTYNKGKYYTNLLNVDLTGNQQIDMVNIAASQSGYREGNSSSQLAGTTSGNKNYTEYGRWYGVINTEWCAMFVTWCARMAGIDSSIVPTACRTSQGYNFYIERNRMYTREQIVRGQYTPKPGDIIYFKSGTSSTLGSHVGLVKSYSGGVIYTIEGNAGNKVAEKSYKTSNTYVVMVCDVDFQGTDIKEKYGKIQVTADSADIKVGPSASHGTLARLYLGDVYGYVSYKKVGGTTWYKLEGNSGWVSSSYVSVVSSSKANAIKNSQIRVNSSVKLRSGPSTRRTDNGTLGSGAVRQVAHISAPGGQVWYGLTDGNWVHGDYVTQQRISFNGSAKVTSSNLDVRQGPSSSTTKMGYYIAGDILRVVSSSVVDSVTWYKLNNGYWVDSRYTQVISTTSSYTAMRSASAPTTKPTTKPTTAPTTKPTTAPTTKQTTVTTPGTTTKPTTAPTTKPTTAPTTAPTTKPTTKPTTQPTTCIPKDLYTIVGYINGKDVGHANDSNTVVNAYNFVNGKVQITFYQDSYVFIKAKDNSNWFMFDYFVEGATGTLRSTNDGATGKMYVPVGIHNFSLYQNQDGTFILTRTKVGEAPATTPTEATEATEITQQTGATGTPTAAPTTQQATYVPENKYTIVGYIDDKDVGCNDDYLTVVPEYNFVNGEVQITFNTDSYVFVKTIDNTDWFMFNSYVTGETGVLHDTDAGSSEKMYVPAGIHKFKLVKNADGTFTLSRTKVGDAPTGGTTATTEVPESETTAPTTKPTTAPTTKPTTASTATQPQTYTPENKYTIVGYIDYRDIGCELDAYTVVSAYNFIDGKVQITFNTNSYIFIKTIDNAEWFMFNQYTTTDSGKLYNTNTGSSEKMFIPAGTHLFTLGVNTDGSLALSRTAVTPPQTTRPTTKPTTAPTTKPTTAPTTKATESTQVTEATEATTLNPEHYKSVENAIQVKAASVNLREDAVSSAKLVGRIYKGAIREYVESKVVSGIKWYKLADDEGWASGSYVTELDGSTVLDIRKRTIKVTSTSVVIRITAGSTAKYSATAYKDDVLQYIDSTVVSGKVWYKVAGNIGWVCESYVEVLPLDSDATEPSETTKPTTAPTTAPTEATTESTEPTTQEATRFIENALMIKVSSANLRATASSSGTLVGRLYKGAIREYISTKVVSGATWYELPNDEGWLLASYVEVIEGGTYVSATPKYFVVSAASVAIKLNAAASAKTTGTLYKNAVLEYTDVVVLNNVTWYKLADNRGWVNGSSVTPK